MALAVQRELPGLFLLLEQSMRTRLLAAAILATSLLAANTASATVILASTFENPQLCRGCWQVFQSADGWTKLSGAGIEIQNHAAGNPAANGGNQFVELDSHFAGSNSSMFYQFNYTGAVTLDFLYSPRPNIPNTSNGITVFLDNVDLMPGVITGAGGPTTSWTQHTRNFNVVAGQRLIFSAAGTQDTLGGYLDNINITAVPEPGTWALMIGGFGLAGAALRRRRAVVAPVSIR
jgi:hypothetical protein